MVKNADVGAIQRVRPVGRLLLDQAVANRLDVGVRSHRVEHGLRVAVQRRIHVTGHRWKDVRVRHVGIGQSQLQIFPVYKSLNAPGVDVYCFDYMTLHSV